MNIGDISKLTGMPAKTIRYYEEIGLVAPPRDINGYRSFGEEDVHRLTFLSRSRALGFSIEECRRLLDLWQNQTRASSDVKALVAEHISNVDQKITDLQAIRETLLSLSSSCAGDDRPDCPIIDGLSATSR